MYSRGIGQLSESPKTPEYEKIGPTRILPHLYIGCAKDALSPETLKANGITHIVNVSSNIDKPPELPDECFLRLPVNDGYIDKLQPYFKEAHEFINKVKSEQKKVMVHCQAGISRSAALTISYIMKSRLITCEQAYRFVKVMRPIVSPNFNFLGQLLEYEKELNLVTSPTSGAGSKRKRINMSLPLGQVSVTDSPQHSKRLSVDNNNVLASLSPASAMAGLRFENSIDPIGCPLPGPSASEESTVVEMRHMTASDLLPPPKRCHSWNGLAELASKSPSTEPTNTLMSPKLRKVGGGPNRPRSLNLSMSNLSVPPAVLELNAKVDNGIPLPQRKRLPMRASADDLLDLQEESEGSLTASNSGANICQMDETTPHATPLHVNKPVFKEIDNSGRPVVLLYKDVSVSTPSLSPATPTVRSIATKNVEETLSQPLLRSFQSSLEQLRTCITSAHTAPSDLNKAVIEDSTIEFKRRSNSLGNLVSPCGDSKSHSLLCMKCGRTDKLNLCHGATTPTTPEILTRPRSMHDSLEMIQVL